jgi:hypothetical protein
VRFVSDGKLSSVFLTARKAVFSLLRDEQRLALEMRWKAYDRQRILVIDPLLSYSSYLGGNLEDSASAVATDAGCNLYVGGGVLSTDSSVTREPMSRRSEEGGHWR